MKPLWVRKAEEGYVRIVELSNNGIKCRHAIDGKEKAEHFQRLLMEYNDWMLQQRRQQEAIRQILMQYYK